MTNDQPVSADGGLPGDDFRQMEGQVPWAAGASVLPQHGGAPCGSSQLGAPEAAFPTEQGQPAGEAPPGYLSGASSDASSDRGGSIDYDAEQC